MKLQKMLTLGVAIAVLFALSHLAVAQNSQTGSQGGGDSTNPGTAGQGGSDATLEIAPQPGLTAPKPGVQEIPGGRNFNPGENNASIEPNFRPKTENGTGDINGNGTATATSRIRGPTSASPCNTRRSATSGGRSMGSKC